MIGKAIHGRLADATSAGYRVYPEVLPQNPTYPAVTYNIIDNVPTHCMGRDAAITRTRVQVDSWGVSYADAHTLANEVAARLSRYKGAVEGVIVSDCLLDNATDVYEDDAQARRVSHDYTILWES